MRESSRSSIENISQELQQGGYIQPAMQSPKSVGGGSGEITSPYPTSDDTEPDYTPTVRVAESTLQKPDSNPHIALGIQEAAQSTVAMEQGGATTRERRPPGDMPMHTFLRCIDGQLQPVELPEMIAYLRTLFNTTSEEIMGDFTPDREGLDIARGDRFLQSLGMSATDKTLEVPVSQRPAVEQLVQRVHTLDPRSIAYYSPNVDISFTFRDPRLEATNGPAVTEMQRIHELVHSDGDYHERVVADASTDKTYACIARLGYMTSNERGESRGFFLGEGLAEYVAGKYIAEELGKPRGLIDAPGEMYTVDNFDSPIALPSRYLYRDMEGGVTGNLPGFAATALGHLVEKDPALLQSLIAGNSNAEARKEVIGRLNTIHPNLYRQLRDRFNTYDDLLPGLKYVRGVLDIRT